MKKLIFLFAFSIAVTNIFAQTDPNQIKKEGNDAFNAKNYPVAYAKFSEYLKQTNNQDSATAYYCGIAADEVKKYAEAVTFFDIAIQKKFNTGNAYARKALALDALKKTDEYVATLEEGLKVDPNNKTMIKNYGLHYLKAGLAGGDIAIAFHPNAAVWLIAAFPYALLHPFKKGRIIPADHLAVIGGALNKRIFRILLH